MLPEVHSSGSLGRRILSNAGFTFLGKVGVYAGNLILTPIVYHALGKEGFGLWALFLLLSGQFGLVDLGFGAALTKYVAEFNASNSMERINRPFTVAVLFYLSTSALLVAVLWAYSDKVLHFFSVPPELWSQTRVFLPVTAVIFFLSSLLGVFQGLVNGLQRMAITNAFAIVQVGSMIGVTAFLLRREQGLGGVVTGLVISLVIGVVGLALSTRRLIPTLKFEVPQRSIEAAPIYSFGATVQLARISGIVAVYSDRVLIGHFLNLESLAQYQLGYTIIALLRGLALVVGPAIVPAASELAGKRDLLRLTELYTRGTKYTLAGGLGVGLMVLTLAPLLTRAWLGHEDGEVVRVIRVLGLGHTFHILTGLGTSICEGIGRAGLEARFGLGLASLQLVFGVIGVTTLGLTGVLLGSTLAMIVTSALFLWRFHHVMQDCGAFEEGVPAKRIVLSVLVAAAAGGLGAHLFPDSRMPQWAKAWFSLVACIAVFGGVYIAMLLSTGCGDKGDRRLVSRIARVFDKNETAGS